MNALKYIPVIAILALSPASYAADVFVSHHETLQRITVHAGDKTGANQGQKKMQVAAPLVLSFDVLGRSFDLELEPNDRITSAIPAEAVVDGVYAYRGRLANNPDSWVRVVMLDDMPRGLVWDGEHMFAIEAPGDSALEISSPVMYRLDDLFIAPGMMTCGAKSISGNAAKAYASMKAELATAVAQAPGAVTEITMGVISDSLFTNAQGGDTAAAAAITARFNNIDGYFSEQVGVQLNVQRMDTFNNATDPFDGTLDPSALLDQLSEYRLQTPAQNSLGLTHLYTGRDFTTTTVGVAWRGALCDSYFSAGLSEGRAGVTTDSLIAAHEIGHNFGAEHDGEPGTSCPLEPEIFIMAPSVNGNEQFSDCSITVMQAEAAAASCVVALPAVDVGIRQNGQVSSVLLGASTDFNYQVAINGTLPATDVVADFTLPGTLAVDAVTTSTGTCNSGAGTVSCDLGDQPGLSSHAITISTTPIAVGVGMLDASVTTADADERPNNDQDLQQLTVDPAVDLVVNAPATAPVFVNDSTTVTATLENLSSLQATSVSLSASLASGLQIDTVIWSIGTCTVNAQLVDCQAASFDAQSSSVLTITATAMTEGSKNVSISLASADAEANPSDNSASGTVNVVSPNSGDDGGGGGTTSPLFLLMIALASMLVCCYKRSFVRQ